MVSTKTGVSVYVLLTDFHFPESESAIPKRQILILMEVY